MNIKETADNLLRQCDAALDGQSNDPELRASARRSIETALQEAFERGRREKKEAGMDEDFKFEYRSASGSRIRHRINRALLSGSDLDLVKAFHTVADNAYELGRREENGACANILRMRFLYETEQVIRARMEKT